MPPARRELVRGLGTNAPGRRPALRAQEPFATYNLGVRWVGQRKQLWRSAHASLSLGGLNLHGFNGRSLKIRVRERLRRTAASGVRPCGCNDSRSAASLSPPEISTQISRAAAMTP